MYSTLDQIKLDGSFCDIDNILTFGANLCKQHSKYKSMKNLKIIYAYLKNLSKGDSLGEVIITGKKTLYSLYFR